MFRGRAGSGEGSFGGGICARPSAEILIPVDEQITSYPERLTGPIDLVRLSTFGGCSDPRRVRTE